MFYKTKSSLHKTTLIHLLCKHSLNSHMSGPLLGMKNLQFIILSVKLEI